MSRFLESQPSLEDCWRGVILLGNNVACYKFALAQSLLELADHEKTFVTLEELAAPFSRHVIEHLRRMDKQGTSRSSRFLQTCRDHLTGKVSEDELISQTARLGFVNVIDAFHKVNHDEVPFRFFSDERRSKQPGISLTDELYQLSRGVQGPNFPGETEARWRLVETAWELGISRSLIAVEYDREGQSLFATDRAFRRVTITSCRDALNGYQKGKCFYCFTDINLTGDAVAHVDHFFPHRLKAHRIMLPQLIDGVWNLVLACPACNLEKLGRQPELRYLERLHTRNEFFIESHHPLRETIIGQMGTTPRRRADHMQTIYSEAKRVLINTWHAGFEYAAAF